MSRFEQTGSYTEETLRRKETPAFVDGPQSKAEVWFKDFSQVNATGGANDVGSHGGGNIERGYKSSDKFKGKPGVKMYPNLPATELQALMETAPGDEPEPSAEGSGFLREAIADAIALLEPLERDVFNRLVIERMTVRAVGREFGISKSEIHRIQGRALVKLQDLLGGHPLVSPKLGDPF